MHSDTRRTTSCQQQETVSVTALSPRAFWFQFYLFAVGQIADFSLSCKVRRNTVLFIVSEELDKVIFFLINWRRCKSLVERQTLIKNTTESAINQTPVQASLIYKMSKIINGY